MFKKGYIYCYIPICEIKLYCIDICYDNNNINDKDIIYIKHINNPIKVKKKFYKKFEKSLLLSNIFSSNIEKKIKNFFNKIKEI